jgi:hypothetical protein
MSEHYPGGCLCGAIRYSMAGAPTSTNVCHCTQCQRQTGAPLPAFASCPEAQLTITGSPSSYRSSERAVRQFCPVCGSSLFWREDGGGEVDVFLGTFDDPNALPPPRYAIWAAHRAAWLPELPNVPAHPGRRPR